MTLIICLDDNNGLMFNNRRQSKDSAVVEDISKMISDTNGFLNCSSYTAKLFNSIPPPQFEEKENFELPKQYHFLEGYVRNLDYVEEIIIYRWNRVYPADTYFEFDLEKLGFKKDKSIEFPGTSHEKITKEKWIKEI